MSDVSVFSKLVITCPLKNYSMQTVFFSIHRRNVRFLATEIFRVYTQSTPNILNEVFPLNSESSYSLRKQQTFASRPIHTPHFRPNSLSYLGPKIWGWFQVMLKIRDCESF